MVGLDSLSLVLSHCSWFPHFLTPQSPSHLVCPLLFISPLLLLPLILSLFLVISPLHHLASAPHCLTPSSLVLCCCFLPLCHCITPHHHCFRVLFHPSCRVDALIREMRNGLQKMNHDKCYGSCFVTHLWGILFCWSPSPSSLSKSSTEQPWATHIPSERGGAGTAASSLVKVQWRWKSSPHPSIEGRGSLPGWWVKLEASRVRARVRLVVERW